MSLRGISHYKANMYSRSSSTTSSQLASLLGRSSVNSRMLKKAYSKLSEKTGKAYLDRTDLSEDSASGIYQGGGISESEKSEALKNAASDTAASAAVLMNSKLSPDETASAAKSFAESYNSAVSAIENAGSGSAAKISGESLISLTASFESALSKAGITINEDSTLSVDETAVKEKHEQIKDMFKGYYSYGARVMKKSSEIQNNAQLTGLSAAGIYNRFGVFGSSSN